MKPSLFIGSSRESLNIANACQQNLFKDAEVTVWNQGIFEISKSNLQSLVQALVNFDFGIFIFTPDDIIMIGKEENKAVRDNVIFELGLFIGFLGRERCFILVPENTEGFRIPTDIIDMIPAEYEPNRRDNNLQAATGPGCTSIREIIKKLGPRSITEKQPSTPDKLTEENKIISTVQTDSKSTGASDDIEWIFSIFRSEYPKARTLLNNQIKKNTEPDTLSFLESWLGTVEYRCNQKVGKESFESLIQKYPTSYHPYLRFADEYKESRKYTDCLEILDRGISAVIDKLPLIHLKSDCLCEMGRGSEALKMLMDANESFKENPDSYKYLHDYYVDNKKYTEARECIEKGLDYLPNDQSLLLSYAKLLYNHFDKKLALVPFNKLIELSPKNTECLTLRGNIYLELELYDLSMCDYRRATEISED